MNQTNLIPTIEEAPRFFAINIEKHLMAALKINKTLLNAELPNESWVTTPYTNYECSNMGRIRNQHGNILRPYTNGDLYWKVKLTDSTYGTRQEYVHQLVAVSFHPMKRGKKQVNHINNNPADNRASNLEWVTPKENCDYKRVSHFISFNE